MSFIALTRTGIYIDTHTHPDTRKRVHTRCYTRTHKKYCNKTRRRMSQKCCFCKPERLKFFFFYFLFAWMRMRCQSQTMRKCNDMHKIVLIILKIKLFYELICIFIDIGRMSTHFDSVGGLRCG